MRWVLITGTRRLGDDVAQGAVRRGWGVIAHYNSGASEAEVLLGKLRDQGGQAFTLQADLSQVTEVGGLVQRAADKAGEQITGLINCAATFEHDIATNFSPASLRRHFDVNAVAPLILTQALAQQTGDVQRSVVNFLDYKLAAPYQDHFSYTVSKYALAGGTEILARALAPLVRVNAVAPAYALPSPGQAESIFALQHSRTPLSYGVTPADVTEAALFLLEAPAVTGQTLYVDAGQRFEGREKDFAFFSS